MNAYVVWLGVRTYVRGDESVRSFRPHSLLGRLSRMRALVEKRVLVTVGNGL
jgi:hypothetical protein